MSQGAQILFVCTGNTCRSYMAETIARSYLSALESEVALQIASAGTGCLDEEPASHQAQAVMSQMGYASDDHRTRRLTTAMVQEADLVLTMTQSQREDILKMVPGARDKVYLLKEYSLLPAESSKLTRLDIMDPYGCSGEDYRACAQEISASVSRALEKFIRG